MSRIDSKDAERDLKRFATKAIPHANRDAINQTAFAARGMWIKRVRDTFTLRNTFTTRQIIVEKARGTDMHSMRAVLGSKAPYQGSREDRQTKRKRGKHGIAVPTAAAAGQTGRRTRPIRKAYQLRAIRLAKSPSGSVRQKNAVAIRKAITSGRRIAYLRVGNRHSIVRVLGAARARRHRFRTLYDLSKPVIGIRAAPTLGPVVRDARKMAPVIFHQCVARQLRINGVFGY